MKKLSLFNIALLLAGLLLAQESLAQNDNPFSLPEGALARLGKGSIGRGDRALAWSPDGTRLAVASSIGIWLYDAANRGGSRPAHGPYRMEVTSVSFSPDGSPPWPVAVGTRPSACGMVASGQEIGHPPRPYSLRSIRWSFSPDGNYARQWCQ